MAGYVIKEMPSTMGNGKKGRIFPKMQVYTEFDYDKVVELIHTNSPAFSPAMKSYLPLGHTMKIDNLGVFSLALQFADEMGENDTQQAASEPKTKYRRVKAKGINFKVDQKLIAGINRENTFERLPESPVTRSPYTREERLQRALRHIDKHGFITLQDYANINNLTRSSASRELKQLVAEPSSVLRVNGAATHKIWVRK